MRCARSSLTARLRGAETVIVGIQPDVAIAMVQFRLNLEPLRVALDLDAAHGAARSPDPGGRRGWRMRSASPITADDDLVTARAEGRAMAERLGFPRPDPTLIATAISEIARNIVVHVGRGEIVLRPFEDARPLRPGRDRQRRRARASATSRRRCATTTAAGAASGLGLPGARRLMDDFEIESDADAGTTVTMRKWRFRDELARLREERRRRA